MSLIETLTWQLDKDVEGVESISASCFGSNLTVPAVTPCLPCPSSGQVGGPGLGAAVLVGWSAFVRLSKGETGSVRVSGRRCQHNSICPCCCQLWRKGSEQGLIISLGGMAADCGWCDTERQFCTLRTSCLHPQSTPKTSHESINAYSEKLALVMRLRRGIL